MADRHGSGAGGGLCAQSGSRVYSRSFEERENIIIFGRGRRSVGVMSLSAGWIALSLKKKELILVDNFTTIGLNDVG